MATYLLQHPSRKLAFIATSQISSSLALVLAFATSFFTLLVVALRAVAEQLSDAAKDEPYLCIVELLLLAVGHTVDRHVLDLLKLSFSSRVVGIV
jgi:hypothetical protein